MLTLPRGAPTTPLYVYLAYHAGPRSVNHFYCTAPLFMHPSFFISADVFPQKVLTAGPSYANISPALSVFCVPPICASGGIGRLARFRFWCALRTCGFKSRLAHQKERHDFCRVFLFGCRSLWHFDALSVKALPAQLFSPADLRIYSASAPPVRRPV